MEFNSVVIYLCSVLCTLKHKKPKHLKKIPKNLGFFPAMAAAAVSCSCFFTVPKCRK